MNDPMVSDEDAADALRHKHPKSAPPRLMAFPGYGGGDAPGAEASDDEPDEDGEDEPAFGSPNVGGVAYGDGEG